jgi:hypothetical protein
LTRYLALVVALAAVAAAMVALKFEPGEERARAPRRAPAALLFF